MKKLIMAVATVAIATMARAASVSWYSMNETSYAVSAFCDAEGNPYTAMPTGVEIVLATITGDLAGEFSVSKELAVSDLDPSAGSMVGGYFEFAYSTTTSENAFNNNDVLAIVAKITDDKGVSYSALEYVTDGSPVTETLTVSGLTGDDWYGELYFAQGGNFTAVPEPTSGLMLILGMAGLALRRKQK